MVILVLAIKLDVVLADLAPCIVNLEQVVVFLNLIRPAADLRECLHHLPLFGLGDYPVVTRDDGLGLGADHCRGAKDHERGCREGKFSDYHIFPPRCKASVAVSAGGVVTPASWNNSTIM